MNCDREAVLDSTCSGSGTVPETRRSIKVKRPLDRWPSRAEDIPSKIPLERTPPERSVQRATRPGFASTENQLSQDQSESPQSKMIM